MIMFFYLLLIMFLSVAAVGVYERCGRMGPLIFGGLRVLGQIFSYGVGILVKEIIVCYH